MTQKAVPCGHFSSRLLNVLLVAEGTVKGYSQVDWVLVVFEPYSVPGYVELPFCLPVFKVEAAELGLPWVWTQVVFKIVCGNI